MTHFFERKDRWGNGIAVWILMAMVFIVPISAFAIRQIQLENDVEKWLPTDDPELKILRWAHSHFPVEERVFVSWDGSSLNDPRINSFAEKLQGTVDADGIRRGGYPHIAKVLEPRDLLEIMQSNHVQPSDAVRRLEGLTVGAGPLRLKLTEFAAAEPKRTIQQLTQGAKTRFGVTLNFADPVQDFWTQVSIPAPRDPNSNAILDPTDPAVINAAGELIEVKSVEHDLHVSWKGMRPGTEQTAAIANWLTEFTSSRDERERLVDQCFFALGSPITVALSISEAGLADKDETVAIIRRVAEEVGIKPESLHMAGSAVSTTELNREVRKAVWDPSFPLQQFHRRSVILTSAILCAGLAYGLVRSIRLASLVLLSSLFATLISVAIIPATGGSMNMVLVVMPSLLMVLTLSGAIHIANYWKHAACRDAATAIPEAIRQSANPCFLASLTTAIGLISLCTSPLIPVRNFGLYAAIGTMLSLGVVLVCLPALLQLWPGKPPAEHELDHPGWRMLGRALTTWPLTQSLIVTAICVACSLGLNQFRTETKVIRYFPDNARIAQDYAFFESYLAGIMPVETVVRFDAQSQKDTSFLERVEVVRQIQSRLRTLPEITGSLSLSDFFPAEQATDQGSSSLARMKQSKRSAIIEDKIRDGEIPSARTFYALTSRAEDLHRHGDAGLNQAEDELWRITSQVMVVNDTDFSTILKNLNRTTQDVLRMHPGTSHTVTGTVPLFLRTQQAVLSSLISSFGLAFALILGVFVVLLRNFWAGLVAMIPNIVPITVVFGLISWFGQKVDVGTMITASIALGIAVDGTLHYLTWVREGMRLGKPRRESIINALVHCGPAMWQTSLAVALGLLVLVPAELLLISRFGWLMAAMIGVALLGDVILMPQLLAGPLGRLFEPPKLLVDPACEPDPTDAPAATQELPATLPSPHISTPFPNDSQRDAA